MNKFVKFPLVLGIVGVICGAALGVVNEITAPIIEQKTYEKVNAAFKDICTGFDKAIQIDTFDADQMSAAGISSAYSLETSAGDKVAYAYQVSFKGYASTVTYLAAIHPTEAKFTGFKVIEENETKKGSLQSDTLPAKFADLQFTDVETNITAEIAGASKSVSNLKESLNKLAEFHNVNVLGGEAKTIDLSDAEIAKLGLATGETILDKSTEYFTHLGDKKAAKAKDAGIENYFHIMNGETKTGFGFVSIVEGFSIEKAGTHTYKIVMMFDNDGNNSKLVVVRTDDTLTTKDAENPTSDKLNNLNYLNGDDYEASATNISDHSFITEFNGKSYTQLNETLANENPFDIDIITGATFTSKQIRKMVVGIISYYANI